MKCINLTFKMLPCKRRATTQITRRNGFKSQHCTQHFAFWYGPLYFSGALPTDIVKTEKI